jgi:hypothetical protein
MTMRAGWLEPRIVHVAWPGRVSNDELARVVDDYTKLVEVGGPYGALFETDGLPHVPATQRQILARWMDEQRYKSHRHCVGVALVTTSALTRGLLTAVTWLATVTPPYPMRTFAARDEAAIWLRGELSQARAKAPRTP